MRSGSQSHLDLIVDSSRYEALLEMADLMVHHCNLPELFHEMAQRLQRVANFEFINISLHDASQRLMRLHIWEGSEQPTIPMEVPVEDSVSGWVWQNQQPLVFPDLGVETRFPTVPDMPRGRGIRSYCMLPLSTAQKQLGALGFGTSKASAYGESDLQLLPRVAELIALAVENALMRQALKEEKERLQSLVEINSLLVSNRDLQKMFPAISESVRHLVRHDYMSILLHDVETQTMRPYARDWPMGKDLLSADTVVPVKDSLAARALEKSEVKLFSHSDLLSARSDFLSLLLGKGIRSYCSIPLIGSKGPLGTLNLASNQEDGFARQDWVLLGQIAGRVAVALENDRAYHEIAALKNKLTEEKLYLEDEIRSELNFEEIIGESTALKRVLSQAKTVAASQATVLILGETGTGKELIARAIHRMSTRKENSFIKMNCAAIPTGLLESELFGHERGAFTGAISQKIGRLELADRGTMFLDEVGDIPLELQPKLLRVLQDQEFERLGSTRTIRVNVRLIAATNRDLGKSVVERQFRSDLFYRLNVFPIRMPPLRERHKDIPLLVRYFVQKFARRMNKQIETIPTETMNALINWSWPGNVRELENFLERSVILTDGSVLRVPLAELQPEAESSGAKDTTLEAADREHIIRLLRETRGTISGANGAAAKLGLKRTTLQSKMQKLGISREDYIL